MSLSDADIPIRDVWASNLHSEMRVIREVLETYPFVAMDTEFPGVVARPIADGHVASYQYQSLRCNVDLLKLIQRLSRGHAGNVELSKCTTRGLRLRKAAAPSPTITTGTQRYVSLSPSHSNNPGRSQ